MHIGTACMVEGLHPSGAALEVQMQLCSASKAMTDQSDLPAESN